MSQTLAYLEENKRMVGGGRGGLRESTARHEGLKRGGRKQVVRKERETKRNKRLHLSL